MTRVAEHYAIVETIPKNGLLGASEADIYEAPAMRQAEVTTLALHNTHASNSNIVYMYLQPSGGTSRRILKQTLAAGEKFVVPPLVMDAGDKVRGYATNADEVSYSLSRLERYRR